MILLGSTTRKSYSCPLALYEHTAEGLRPRKPIFILLRGMIGKKECDIWGLYTDYVPSFPTKQPEGHSDSDFRSPYSTPDVVMDVLSCSQMLMMVDVRAAATDSQPFAG